MSQQILIVGRLLSMTRAEATRVVKLTGGELAERLTRATSLVVIGGRGPQLAHDGRVLLQLARARRLVQEGVPLEVWPEESWLRSLGLAQEAAGVQKHFTAGQMAEALQIPRARIDRWLAAGLLQPVEVAAGIPLFDFPQVSAARTLAELAEAGIHLAHMRRALAQLATWLPNIGQPLANLGLAEEVRRRLVVRTPDGRRAEPSGQLLFEFDVPAEGANSSTQLLKLDLAETHSEAFRRAVSCEQNDRPQEAAAIYVQLIAERGPHPTLAFNLGNALYAADDAAGALAAFRQATQLDPEHAAAWNNLANVLAELDQLEEATAAYRRSLAHDPHSADTHFNLAETLVELGRGDEAMLHWQAFLAVDRRSAWADYACERLALGRMP